MAWPERSPLARQSSSPARGARSQTPEGVYAQGRRAELGGRSRRNRSIVAYACLQSETSSATLAPWRAASSDTGSGLPDDDPSVTGERAESLDLILTT
jgi:hypothetical protein